MLNLSLYKILVFPDIRNQSDINSIAAQQHETWATLGFLRGVSTTKQSGRAFCTRRWIELMMEVIKEASPLARSKGSHSKALVQQVSTYQTALFNLILATYM